MLAMCVRKPGDSAGSTSLVHPQSTTTATASVQIKTRKIKSSGLKALKRGSKSEAERTAELSFSHQQPLAPPSSRLPPTSLSTSAAGVREGEASPAKVRDDPEGHLIYTRGDRLETRCECVSVCINKGIRKKVCERKSVGVSRVC